MKVARRSFLGVLLGLLLLAMFLTLHIQAASQVSTKVTIDESSPQTSVHVKVVNADSIVYWRSDPDWKTPLTMVQQGVYTGDTVSLACYTRGSTAPPNNNNPLWYWAEVVSGRGQGSGWVNDHFLNTGTNQPNIPVNNILSCSGEPYPNQPESGRPYVWSHTSNGANLRWLPKYTQTGYLLNNTALYIDCWIDGVSMKGDYWSNIWLHAATGWGENSEGGYINASLVANLHTVPKCDSSSLAKPVSMVFLSRGPLVSDGIYNYTIMLSDFPANAAVTVKCYDSVSPSGFHQFDLRTDGGGQGFTQSKCYSGDGPDHWVVAGGVTSNYIQWGSGGTNNPPITTPKPKPAATPTPKPIATPTPKPAATPTSKPTPPSHPVDAYSNYGPANTGYPICRGNPNNSQSMPGGKISQTFTVPVGVASLNSALVQIDPDSTVTAHLSLAVNGNVVATGAATAVGDTKFGFGPVHVSAGDVITLSISFTATYGKIITVYTAGHPGGTFTTSNSCLAGAANVSFTNTGLRARISGMS